MAGVMGAKEGEACGAEDSDTCGTSLYKASLTCGIRGPGLEVLEARGWAPRVSSMGRVTMPGVRWPFIDVEHVVSDHTDR